MLIGIYNSAFYDDFIRYGQCQAYGQSREEIEAVLLSDDENWVGINQILSNKLVEYFFNEHELDEIVSDFDSVQRETSAQQRKADARKRRDDESRQRFELRQEKRKAKHRGR